MIAAKIKKWGNSYGLLIPKDELKKMNVTENQEVFIEITKKENPLKELFGYGKTKIDTEKILKEIRKNQSKYI